MEGGLKLIKEEPLELTNEERDSESASPAADDEIEPLSGKPFFHVLLQKSHIITPLVIPAKISRMLPSTIVPVTLTCSSRTWEMTYLGNNPTQKKFDINWKTFVADKKLKVGDACVFELMENVTTIKFKVQILRGDFPLQLLSKPIVID